MVGDTTKWGQIMSESVEEIIRRIAREELERAFNGRGCPDPFMHDAAAGRLVPPPEKCSWNPITAAPDCDFDPGCSVHGKGSMPEICAGCTHPRDQHGPDGCCAGNWINDPCPCERVNGA